MFTFIFKTDKKSVERVLLFFALILVSIQTYAKNDDFNQNQDSAYFSYSGVIFDAKDGDKLPFAHISIIASSISTVTNSEGEFLLKVPIINNNSTIEISFIGYETFRIPLNSLKSTNNKIGLKQSSFMLPEVEIMPKNPLDLVKRMLDEREKNYCKKDMWMRAFYREIIRKKNAPISISEAIIDVYKQSYADFQQDKVSIFKSRKSSDYSKLDTLVFKLMGGPFNTLFIDVVKYPEYFLNYNNLNDYIFQYESNDRIDNRLIYVVNFKQDPNILDPLPQGKLYIDAQTFGLVKADFDINLKEPETASMLFIRKKPFNARVFTTRAHYMVDYTFVNNKWQFAYSRVDLGLKIDWKKRFFNTYYNTAIEMAATNWKENADKNDLNNRIFIRPTVVLFDAINGFQDTDFWGENNIIEPEKSIENAINKIQKQLKKTSK